ncbi:aspartyl/asparaginyl beta-hydroxylase domain-containing protein [Endozoicomonas sp.]|nr:aspartyl/asparaginyl beta-hydroxylase domain-containing protein [Endozoicomonas sp.]
MILLIPATVQISKCFITVDGEIDYWKEGESVMFDEIHSHFAENHTIAFR